MASRHVTPTPKSPAKIDAEEARRRAEFEVAERLEQNRLAEDSFEDAVEEAEEARRDEEADKADHGD